MAIWEWALEAYARPGVCAACLALQDDAGQNVPYLLWSVWAEAADPQMLARAAETARGWEEAAVAPLRTVRRTLKAARPGIAERLRLDLREDVKAVELKAERVLMESLAQLAGEASGGAPALQALQAASKAWGRPAPDVTLAALAGALG